MKDILWRIYCRTVTFLNSVLFKFKALYFRPMFKPLKIPYDWKLFQKPSIDWIYILVNLHFDLAWTNINIFLFKGNILMPLKLFFFCAFHKFKQKMASEKGTYDKLTNIKPCWKTFYHSIPALRRLDLIILKI